MWWPTAIGSRKTKLFYALFLRRKMLFLYTML